MRTRTTRCLTGRLTGLTAALMLTSALSAVAQTPYVPYFGKNQIRYDNFRWHIYTTDHFEIYYYPEIEQHLERVAGYAESAYQQVSADLKHDLAFKIPLILFKTSSEFQQQNIIPGAAQEGVGAFAEPFRDRMVLPIDEPPDLLYRLVVHELTHIFEFDIIPQSLIRRSVPLWVNEGLSDYMTGIWRPIDLMTVRDAAVADTVPKMSELEGYGGFSNPRLIYNLGHTVFEFIESKWGKEGIRQFMFALRKSVIGGGEDAYEEAFQLKPEEFDQQFEKYLKDRFKAFRDKERPADYGRNLSPNPQKTKYTSVLSIEPAPSGDLMAAMVGNRREQELDIVLLSTKDGTVVRNLTKGFDQGMGFAYISTPGGRWNTVSWMSWSPVGDQLAYFVRTEKEKSLILQDVVSTDVKQRFPMRTVDEPESPSIAPGGRYVAFSGLRNAIGDIFLLDTTSGDITNLTDDAFADYAPTFSPDGKSVVYLARISGNEKLFSYDLATKKKTQLTFGTHDEGQAKFIDGTTLVFPSTAVNPTQPIEPEVARNGNIFNIWTLSLVTGELRQYTDAASGNVSPVAAARREGQPDRLRHLLQGRVGRAHARTQGADPDGHGERLRRGHRRDGGLPAADDAHAGEGEPEAEGHVREDVPRRPAAGERRRHQRRRPVWRHAGHLQRRARRQAVQRLCRVDLAVPDLLGQLHEPVAAFPVLPAGLLPGAVLLRHRIVLLRSGLQPDLPGSRQRPGHAHHARRQRVWHLPVQPLSPRRAVWQPHLLQRALQRPDPGGVLEQLPGRDLRHAVVPRRHGHAVRRGVRPGNHRVPGVRAAVGQHDAPVVRDRPEDRRFAVVPDRRPRRAQVHQTGRIGTAGPAGQDVQELGRRPGLHLLRRQLRVAGYEYLQFTGHNVFFFNAELRFPLIEAMLTPLGVMGGVRGVFFFGTGGAYFNDQPCEYATSKTESYTPYLGSSVDPATGTPDSHLRAAGRHHRLPAARRQRVVRLRPRDVRAGLPHPLRLGVADDVQPRVGRRAVCVGRRQRRVPARAVQGVDWVRLLN